MTTETDTKILERLEQLETEVKELRSQLEEKNTNNEKIKCETLVDLLKYMYDPYMFGCYDDDDNCWDWMGDTEKYNKIKSISASNTTPKELSYYFDKIIKMKIDEYTKERMESLEHRIYCVED